MSGEHNIGSGPIEEKYGEVMRVVGSAIDNALNGPAIKKRKVGYVLMVFPFDDFDGRCNYISNAQREDVITLLREQLAYFSGAPDDARGSA